MEKPVVLSKHAFVRMRERFPNVAKVEDTVVREVRAAIEAGRRSKTKPEWASTYTRVKGDHSIRFVWNQHRSRCYAVAARRVAGIQGLIVVTVLPAGDPSTLERFTLSKGPPRQTRTGKHAPRSVRSPKWKG